MNSFKLVRKSMSARWGTLGLSMLSVGLSIGLILSVTKAREGARRSFEQTISGSDLLVGARTSALELIFGAIYRTFPLRYGLSTEVYNFIKSRPEVAWVVPLSLGDSHRGYAVLGTEAESYFRYYQYGAQETLAFAAGSPFKGPRDIVIGSEVAAQLGYDLGSKIILAHGLGEHSFEEHHDHPFSVVGVLKPTGTPVDRTLHVALEALELIHHGAGVEPDPDVELEDAENEHIPEAHEGGEQDSKHAEHSDHEAEGESQTLSALLVGLKEKSAVLAFQRQLNDYEEEALSAVLPGQSFQELWRTLALFEQTLSAISFATLLSGLLAMMALIWASLDGRRHEMAVLRALGAQPRHICWFYGFEALIVSLGGVCLGLFLSECGVLVWGPQLRAKVGLDLRGLGLSMAEFRILGLAVGGGILAALIPALRAMRMSLRDGLKPRI